MLRVGVLGDVQVLLDGPAGIGQERPLGADRCAELFQDVMVVGGDSGDLGVGHRDLRVAGRQLEVLLVLFRAVVAARQGEDQRIAALKLAQRTHGAGVVRESVIREGAARSDVRTHGMIASPLPPRVRPGRCSCRFARRTWLYQEAPVPAGRRARRRSCPHFRLARKPQAPCHPRAVHRQAATVAGGWSPAQGRARVSGSAREVRRALRGKLAVQQAGELADFDEISVRVPLVAADLGFAVDGRRAKSAPFSFQSS